MTLLLVSNVPPLGKWIEHDEGARRPRLPDPECFKEVIPVYQGHVYRKTSSVGMVQTVEITTADGQESSFLRDTQQLTLKRG